MSGVVSGEVAPTASSPGAEHEAGGAGAPAGAPSRSEGAMTIREARARYFVANGLSEAGYDARWVRLQAGPVPLFFPNTAGRVRAVRVHDVHHVLTGYATTWTGEGEIGAWELASGCADHYAAWVLNLLALAIGLGLAPAAMERAFVRGRRSANLYRVGIDDAILATPVATARRRLGLDLPTGAPTVGERIGFLAWSALGVAMLALAVMLTLAPLAALIALIA